MRESASWTRRTSSSRNEESAPSARRRCLPRPVWRSRRSTGTSRRRTSSSWRSCSAESSAGRVSSSWPRQGAGIDAARASTRDLRRVRRLVSPRRLRRMFIHQCAPGDGRSGQSARKGKCGTSGVHPLGSAHAGGGSGVQDSETFAHSWHILMKGSIVAAGEGDELAGKRARAMGEDLLDRYLRVTGGSVAASPRVL